MKKTKNGEKKMNTVIQNAIEAIVRGINGAVFASADYTIEASNYIRKGATDGVTEASNPFWDRKDDIKCKRTNVQINLGVIYPKAVNGRLERKEIEHDFEASPMRGKRAHENPHKNLCQNLNGTKTYLRYMPMQNKNNTTVFLLDGEDITDALKPYMAKKTVSKKQEKAGLEGKEQIQWRTLGVANIDALRVLGTEISDTQKAELTGKLEAEKEKSPVGEKETA